jgi:2'-5' RNA ligase
MQELNRAFVGIRLPAAAQQKLAETQLTLRHKAGSDVLRFSSTEEMHIVLMSLGELNMATFEMVKGTLPKAAAGFKPFAITIEGLGGTPSNLQPRFIWAGIGGNVAELTRLHNETERWMLQVARSYQPTPFKAHVDLGRIKTESEANRTALGRALRMTQVGVIFDLQVSQIELFRSTATTQGPHLVSYGTYALSGQ